VRPLEARKDEIAKDMKLALCLLVLRFVYRNPQLRQLLDAGEPSWAAVGRVLGDMTLNSNIFEEFNDLDARSSSEPGVPADQALLSVVQRYADEFRRFASDGQVLQFLKGLDFSTALVPFFGICRRSFAGLLAGRRLELADYEFVLRDLYLKRLIANLGTTFWCRHCHDDPFLMSTQSRLGPDQVAVNCPKCQRQTMVATLYEVHPLVRAACLSTDGLLGIAVGWLLRSKHIEFVSNTYARDQETDYRFTVGARRVLLECKQHKTHKDLETTRRHLSDDVSKAVKHAQAIRESNEVVTDVWIVTNYERALVHAEFAHVEADRRAEMAAYNVKFIEPAELPRRLAGQIASLCPEGPMRAGIVHVASPTSIAPSPTEKGCRSLRPDRRVPPLG